AGLAAHVDPGDIHRLQFGNGFQDRGQQDIHGRRRVGQAGLDDLRLAGQGLWLVGGGVDYSEGGVAAPYPYSRRSRMNPATAGGSIGSQSPSSATSRRTSVEDSGRRRGSSSVAKPPAGDRASASAGLRRKPN